ncbi:MAG: F0F1 ATP synthase subunit gamma [Candidatus Omnitrophica bacterium]|nr:F0F1 ATP synthase subunit gamma [Candidatus Omnitrophota bacterium]
MSKIAVLKLRNRLKREFQIIDTIDVLKRIAVSEFQFLDKQRVEASQFLRVLESFFGFYHAWKLKDSAFFESACDVPGVVVMSSDEGFQGAVNAQILERAMQHVDNDPKTRLIVVGRRGAKKLADAGMNVVEFPGIPFPLEYGAVSALKAYLIDQFIKKEIGSITIIYSRCQSFTRQTMAEIKLLPFNVYDLDTRSADDKKNEELLGYVICEPDRRRVVEYTMALWFGRKLYEIYWDSKLSEVASRAIELNERFEDLSRKSKKTQAQYFRANHEVIDAGIREIFASHHFFSKEKGIQYHEG